MDHKRTISEVDRNELEETIEKNGADETTKNPELKSDTNHQDLAAGNVTNEVHSGVDQKQERKCE